jgi:ubiquinone/menaquinone biosynthesis C-methylase UbiE
LDVTNMSSIDSSSIDVINAIELFEHVNGIEKGLEECARVLKPEGKLIISVPFLYPFHADPNDFQRWTETKWHHVLLGMGFEVEKTVIMGRFFTVYGDMVRMFASSMPGLIKKILYIFYPILDCLVWLDQTPFVLKNKILSSYHEGYFIIARRKGK